MYKNWYKKRIYVEIIEVFHGSKYEILKQKI